MNLHSGNRLLGVFFAIAASLGCDEPISEYKGPAFTGDPGARFFAVNPDDPSRQALTDSTRFVYAETKTAGSLQINSLPLATMRAECVEKITESEGQPAVVLISPKSSTGVVWTEDDKIVVKRKVTVEDAQPRWVRDGIIAGGQVRLTYSMTADQFKEALNWFTQNPCANPGGE